MIKLDSYLTFNGNTEEAFNFYKSVFDGDFLVLQRFKEMPEGTGEVSQMWKDKIVHVALKIGNDTLMGSDPSENMKVNIGNNFSLSLNVESKKDADKYFKALSSGGKVQMPLADAFWGSYFGMLVDKFGVQWMVSYAKEKNK